MKSATLKPSIDAVRPIFIIGAHRSGTTWLSNLLASVPGIYAPAHSAHRGVHESAFFSHLVSYCNHGREESDLLAIKYLFEKSDFFLLTGLDSGPDIVKHGYGQYFRLVMEAAARRNKAGYWLEKTPAHTLYAKLIMEHFPDATLIAVTRDYRGVVQSKIYGFGDPGSIWQWLRQSAVTAIYERVIACSGAFIVRYEDLQADPGTTLKACLERLGIEASIDPTADVGRNSSFDAKPPRFTRAQRMALLAGRAVVFGLPAALVERLATRWVRRTRAGLPGWFFLLRERDQAPMKTG